MPKYYNSPGGDSPTKIRIKPGINDIATMVHSRTPMNQRKVSYAVATADIPPFERAGAVTEMGHPMMQRNSSSVE